MALPHRRRVPRGRHGSPCMADHRLSSAPSQLTLLLPPQEFLAVYRTLRDQLADDPIIADQPPAAREWLVEVTAAPSPVADTLLTVKSCVTDGRCRAACRCSITTCQAGS